jgi:hypothetical protein
MAKKQKTEKETKKTPAQKKQAGRYEVREDMSLETEEKLEEILYPSSKAKIFKITLVFGFKHSPKYEKAVELAKKNAFYQEEGSGEWVRHSATYTPETVEELFQLFNLVHEWEKTEVLVNHKKIPYGHQLWLPLMWFYRIK